MIIRIVQRSESPNFQLAVRWGSRGFLNTWVVHRWILEEW